MYYCIIIIWLYYVVLAGNLVRRKIEYLLLHLHLFADICLYLHGRRAAKSFLPVNLPVWLSVYLSVCVCGCVLACCWHCLHVLMKLINIQPSIGADQCNTWDEIKICLTWRSCFHAYYIEPTGPENNSSWKKSDHGFDLDIRPYIGLVFNCCLAKRFSFSL